MTRNAICSGMAAAGLLAMMLTVSACSSNTKQAETTPAAAPPATPATPKLSDDDKSFMSTAAKAGYEEIQLGKLALKKSHSKDVREYAQKLIDDHEKAASSLAKIAATKGVTLPDSASLAASFSEGKLKMDSGRHFDQAFLAKMVDDHKDAVATFQKEAAQGSDTDVKDFASTTIPTLQEHLDKAQTLENETNVHKGSKSS
jgi:putative membrane protein